MCVCVFTLDPGPSELAIRFLGFALLWFLPDVCFSVLLPEALGSGFLCLIRQQETEQTQEGTLRALAFILSPNHLTSK